MMKIIYTDYSTEYHNFGFPIYLKLPFLKEIRMGFRPYRKKKKEKVND